MQIVHPRTANKNVKEPSWLRYSIPVIALFLVARLLKRQGPRVCGCSNRAVWLCIAALRIAISVIETIVGQIGFNLSEPVQLGRRRFKNRKMLLERQDQATRGT